MISIDNIEYRNLEEQVQKNKEDIANHYNMDRVLADFGIRVIGRVNTPEELPDPDTFMGQYGDAYAVGMVEEDQAASPFTFYIWTRPDPDAGHDTAYWFNIGELAIVGPQGPQGDPGGPGPAGTRGSLWYSGSAIPANASNYNIGDIYLRNTGEVYQVGTNGVNKIWNKVADLTGPVGPAGEEGLRGPQGEQGEVGPAGPKGDTGALCRIVGSITSVSQLPTPTEDIRYNGYTQTVNDETHLWIITGDTSLQWMDIGVVGGAGGAGGTNVVVNGVVQDEWDASKVLMNPITSSTGFLYQTSAAGTYTTKTGQQGIATANVDTTAPATRYYNGAMDVMRTAALTTIINTITSNGTVPDRTPTSANDGALRSNQAAPRGYVDTLVQHTADQVSDDLNLTLGNALGALLERPTDNPTFESALLGLNTDGTIANRQFAIEGKTVFGNSADATFDVESNVIYFLVSTTSKMRIYNTSNLSDTTHYSRNFAIIVSGTNPTTSTNSPIQCVLSKASVNTWAASVYSVDGALRVDMGDNPAKIDTLSIFKVYIK